MLGSFPYQVQPPIMPTRRLISRSETRSHPGQPLCLAPSFHFISFHFSVLSRRTRSNQGTKLLNDGAMRGKSEDPKHWNRRQIPNYSCRCFLGSPKSRIMERNQRMLSTTTNRRWKSFDSCCNYSYTCVIDYDRRADLITTKAPGLHNYLVCPRARGNVHLTYMIP